MERMKKIAASFLSHGEQSKATVAVVGAAGGIGQPLSLLLKLCAHVGELRLYDVVNTPGVAADLSHISTAARVKAFVGPSQLDDALAGCDLVVIPAGVPRKPGMTRDDLFAVNAGIVRSLCEAVARKCPHAWVAIITNPVNSTVPVAAEVLKRFGAYDPNRLFGVTALDVVRAEEFLAAAAGAPPGSVRLPVVGGHAGSTILPLISQAQPPVHLAPAVVQQLVARVQDAGTEVVAAKAGAGSATLSMAYAAARFVEACLRARAGEEGIVECAYVESHVTELPYFACRVRLGPHGVAEQLPLGPLSAEEQQGLDAMKAELLSSIQKGIEFAHRPGQ